MKRFGSMQEVASRKTKNVFLVGFAFAAAVSASTGAFAQVLPANCTATNTSGVTNLFSLATPAGSTSSLIAGTIGNVNTAFLTQQGSAFVSAPPNPAPDQPGGGVWTRGVAGEVTTKTSSFSSGIVNVPADPSFNGTATTACSNVQRQTFAGIQVGADISRLNWGGWNLHLGTTAGYLGSSVTDNNGFRAGFEVPFIGTYLVATYGRFFADVLVRQEFYQLALDNPNSGLFNQPIGAHGISISASAGYNFALANNWFIEPSAGFVWSKTKVDSFNTTGILNIGGTIATQDITSEIGRLSVRVGTTISTPNVTYQPFASASIFHEFAGDVNSSFANCVGCAFVGGNPLTFTQTTGTSRVGTYGQYSLGLAAQFVNTGWLAFVRGDYRNGDKIDGYTGNVGLRYQFTPEAYAAPRMHTKSPVMAPVYGTTNWTGLYAGGFFGAAYGETDIRFNDPAATSTRPYVFGPIGGAQVGYNYQVNNWVYGLEGDIGGARLRGGRTCGNFGLVAGASFNPFFQDCTDRLNWMATASARLGYAAGRTLYYVRAGGAWAEDARIKVDCIDPTITCANPAGVPYPALNPNGTETTQARSNRFGWMVGFGTEFDLGKNWSAKADYNYIDFGRNSNLASDGTTVLTDRSTLSQVKIGVNYRWGGQSAVVARY
jgi:opacity protein-like surface antigen